MQLTSKICGNKIGNGCVPLLSGTPEQEQGKGGQQERKGTEDHIQQIFIILFPNHVLLILLGTAFVLIRE